MAELITPDPLHATLAEAGLAVEPAEDAGFWISGATFARRELLKCHGGSWSRERQAWHLPSHEALARLAAALPTIDAAAPRLAEQAAPAAFAGWGSKHYHGHRERLRQRFA